MTCAQAVTTTTQAAIATELHADAAEFNVAEIVAIAHLYRGEMCRSKIWRTRLDPITNFGGGDDRHRHHGVPSWPPRPRPRPRPCCAVSAPTGGRTPGEPERTAWRALPQPRCISAGIDLERTAQTAVGEGSPRP
jgi:hypothetical protein